jgi:hypothetical protein
MECFSSKFFRDLLPNITFTLFTRNDDASIFDDASFWGGEENLYPVMHHIKPPCARTEPVVYEPKYKDFKFALNEPGERKQIVNFDICQATKSHGEYLMQSLIFSILIFYFIENVKGRRHGVFLKPRDTSGSDNVERSVPRGF